jgi:hypothetical protein
MMQNSISDLTNLSARVEQLERANRRLKWAVFAALFAAMLVGCARRSNTVEADRFMLRDKQGRVRAEMAMSYDTGPNGNPSLVLLDENGKERTSVDAGNLTISHDSLKEFTTIDAGGLRTWQDDGKKDVTLLVDRLQFSAGAGATARLEGGPGTAALWLFGHDQGGGAILIDAKPVIELSDANGFRADLGRNDLATPRTGGTHSTSAATLVLSGKDGKVLWSAP